MRFLPYLFLSFSLVAGSAAGAQSPAAASGIAPYQPRFERDKPIVAVIGANTGTELSDFVLPYAILTQAGVAEVHALATEAGPLQLRPALRIAPNATLAQFDTRHPEGADYVIVPALSTADHPAMIAWLQAQSAKGATVVSICDGALVVARAGLFKGRRATGHWFTHKQRERDFPETRWLKNVRYVADGNVVSSAGISAAIPVSLALVEAIGGQARAATVAAEIGAPDWNDRHDSEQFSVSAGMLLTLARNKLFSRPEQLGLALEPGMDDLTLALGADAFNRTRRAKAVSLSATSAPVRTRHGLEIIPDQLMANDAADVANFRLLQLGTPARPLDSILDRIAAMYGRGTAKLVADEMEYARASRPGETGAASGTDESSSGPRAPLRPGQGALSAR